MATTFSPIQPFTKTLHTDFTRHAATFDALTKSAQEGLERSAAAKMLLQFESNAAVGIPGEHEVAAVRIDDIAAVQGIGVGSKAKAADETLQGQISALTTQLTELVTFIDEQLATPGNVTRLKGQNVGDGKIATEHNVVCNIRVKTLYMLRHLYLYNHFLNTKASDLPALSASFAFTSALSSAWQRFGVSIKTEKPSVAEAEVDAMFKSIGLTVTAETDRRTQLQATRVCQMDTAELADLKLQLAAANRKLEEQAAAAAATKAELERKMENEFVPKAKHEEVAQQLREATSTIAAQSDHVSPADVKEAVALAVAKQKEEDDAKIQDLEQQISELREELAAKAEHIPKDEHAAKLAEIESLTKQLAALRT